MRQAIGLSAGLLALTHSFPGQATADDVQSALADTAAPQTQTVDPDTQVTLARPELENWRASRSHLCLMFGEQADSPVEQQISQLIDRMAQSPLADRLFTSLEDTTATLCSTRARQLPAQNSALYSGHTKAAILRLGADAGEVVFSGLHELRHAWQDQNGLLSPVFDEETLQDHLGLVYMVEADATAYAVAAAWQLREAGDPAAWNYAMEDPDYQPVAQVFEAAMGQAQSQGLEPEAAMRQSMRWGYTAWFQASRASVVYAHNLWDDLRQMPSSADTPSPRFATVLRGLGQLPGTPSRASYLGRAEMDMAIDRSRELIPINRPAPAQTEGDAQPAAEAVPEQRRELAR
ncbi:MAG: DUF6782 family putative metallopeptidase [Pseudomonadota bacterium]